MIQIQVSNTVCQLFQLNVILLKISFTLVFSSSNSSDLFFLGGSRTTTSSNGAFPSGGRTIGSSTSGRTTGSSRGGSVLLSGGRMVTSLSAGSTINRILSGIQPNRFVPALLGPGSAPSTGRSQQLGRGGGRTLITPPCQKRFITDANNRIIAGACVTTNKTTPSPTPTGSSGNSRAKRQVSM